jgi:hypothetical protein
MRNGLLKTSNVLLRLIKHRLFLFTEEVKFASGDRIMRPSRDPISVSVRRALPSLCSEVASHTILKVPVISISRKQLQ